MNEHEPNERGSDLLRIAESTFDCDEFQIQRFDWEGGTQNVVPKAEDHQTYLGKENMDRIHDIRLATDDWNDRPLYSDDR